MRTSLDLSMRRFLSLSHGRRRSWSTVVLAAWITAMFFLLLPYDSVLRQSVRFNAVRAFNSLASPSWSASASRSTQDSLYDSIGLVIKSGYGTRHRVPAQIAALGLRPHAQDAHNLIVVGDYTGLIPYTYNNGTHSATVPVHNVIAPVLESRAIGSLIHAPRAVKYRGLSTAIRRGDDGEAMGISRDYGWELDTMKFVPGLELALDAMPDKDWYLLIDDDTFLVPSSLRSLLARLDPSTPLYLGNAVGDFRVRFAHGGSAIVLSRAAVVRLAAARAIVHRAYVESLTTTWGDRLLAVTLMRLGIYLDERFSWCFNGARPHATRISADRFCLPLVSFHGLTSPDDMVGAGRRYRAFANASEPLVWGDLWALYRRPTGAALQHEPLRHGRDFVGRPGDDSSAASLVSTSYPHVASPEACRAVCEGVWVGENGDNGDNGDSGDSRRPAGHHQSPLPAVDGACLAWAWDGQTETCTTSPWFVIGEDPWEEGGRQAAPATMVSGVPAARLEHLVHGCGGRSNVPWSATDAGYALRGEDRD